MVLLAATMPVVHILISFLDKILIEKIKAQTFF